MYIYSFLSFFARFIHHLHSDLSLLANHSEDFLTDVTVLLIRTAICLKDLVTSSLSRLQVADLWLPSNDSACYFLLFWVPHMSFRCHTHLDVSHSVFRLAHVLENVSMNGGTFHEYLDVLCAVCWLLPFWYQSIWKPLYETDKSEWNTMWRLVPVVVLAGGGVFPQNVPIRVAWSFGPSYS